MAQNESKRWHKNNQAARFIVRKLLEKNIDKNKPDVKQFVKEFPDFGEYDPRKFRRNFRNTITRWNTFVSEGQGKSEQKIEIYN